MDLKVGDVVKLRLNTPTGKSLRRVYGTDTGTVQSITLWEGELTPENHGVIEINFNGEIDHFAYYGWEKVLIVQGKS